MSDLDKQVLRALGLISGTSMDGIDAAIIETDGHDIVRTGPWLTRPYTPAFRQVLNEVVQAKGRGPVLQTVEKQLTDLHIHLVDQFLSDFDEDIDIIGFHGHTVDHDPARQFTWQIGDGLALANASGLSVVSGMRLADVAAGGHGAPLVPLYHQALARDLEKPLAVLNIGGVANVTYLSETHDPVAFDTGPGNALIDDLFLARTDTPFDENGEVAARGKVDTAILSRLMQHSHFSLPVPKSLDRNAFDGAAVGGLSLEDAAATLVAFTAESIARARDFFPAAVKRWLVTGGGRHNQTLMQELQKRLGVPVEPVETVGWQGDALEAQAFAYLAVRSLKGLPLTLPTTTGISHPLTGGILHSPNEVWREAGTG